jgi:hypothetical protein
MRRLALALCLLASPVYGASMQFRAVHSPNDRVLTREQSLLRAVGGVAAYEPNYACDYTKGRLCGAENWYRRTSSNWTYRDANGFITYAPNNLFTNSAAPSGTRTIATDGNGKYILKCSGTGTISYTGTATGSRSCPGEVLLSPAAGNITLTVSGGNPLFVRFSEVMHETTLPAADNYDNGSVAWLPARVDGNGWLLEGIIPDCCGEGTTTYQPVKNLLAWSNALNGAYYAPASANTTVSLASGVVSPDGTENAWRITNVTNSNDGFSTANPVTVTSGGSYAWSAHIKRDSANWVMLDFLDPAGPTSKRAWFNIQTGATGTICAGCAVSFTPDPSGNGWYRVSLGVAGYAASSVKPTMKLVAGDNTTTGCVCAVWSFGWQLDDRGAGPFSYTPTNGQVAVRDPERAMSTDPRLAGAQSIVFELGSKPQRLYGATSDVNLMSFNSGPSIGAECGAVIDCSIVGNPVLTNTGVGLTTGGAFTTNYASVATSTIADWTGRNRFALAMTPDRIALAMNGGPVASAKLTETGKPIANVWLDIAGGYVRSIAAYRDPLPAHVLREKSKR